MLFKTLDRRWQCLEKNRIPVYCVPSDNEVIARVVLPQFLMAFIKLTQHKCNTHKLLFVHSLTITSFFLLIPNFSSFEGLSWRNTLPRGMCPSRINRSATKLHALKRILKSVFIHIPKSFLPQEHIQFTVSSSNM